METLYPTVHGGVIDFDAWPGEQLLDITVEPGQCPIGSRRRSGGRGDGYLKGDRLVQLGPKRTAEEVRPAFTNDQAQPAVPLEPKLVDEAVQYYQTASYRFTHGLMRDLPPAPSR